MASTRYRPFLIGMIVGMAIMFFVVRPARDHVAPQQTTENKRVPFSAITLAQTTELLADEKNTINVFHQVSPAVVFITNNALQRDFFTLDVQEIPRGSGSGFVWDQNGHIVTNYHVIADANSLSVKFGDQSTFQADVIGAEPNKDIAVIRVKAPANRLHPVAVGSSDKLIVGQKVVAIGNPFGLDQTLTVGVVSALGREIESVTERAIHDVIQTDAAINPGNSGGPLLDSGGRLIGMNTAIVSPSGAYAGIGFAVPVNVIKSIVPQLIQHGKIVRPGLGVGILSDQVARNAGIEGVIIGNVTKGSPAEKAGLRGVKRNLLGQAQLGDVIIAVDGTKVTNANDLAEQLEKHKVGDEVTLTILRDEKEQKVKARLQPIS